LNVNLTFLTYLIELLVVVMVRLIMLT